MQRWDRWWGGRKKKNRVYVSVSEKSTVHKYVCYVFMSMYALQGFCTLPQWSRMPGARQGVPPTLYFIASGSSGKRNASLWMTTLHSACTMCSEINTGEASLRNGVVSSLNEMDIELLTLINRQKRDHWDLFDAGMNLIQAMASVTSTWSILPWIPEGWMDAGVKDLNII